MPRKDGSVLAATNTEFKYSHFYPDSRHIPDPNNPVVIKMRKLQGAEPLVRISKDYKLPFTGSPLFFDLLTGKVSDSGGDLRVLVTRTPGPISQQVHGDWSIELVPVKGGIMESEFHLARVTFEAPADSYQDKWLVQMGRDNPKWFDNLQKVFFLKSRGGQVYSKFSMEFMINDGPGGLMWFQFKGVANDHYSRNWEEPQGR
jgi:hypothetical protein